MDAIGEDVKIIRQMEAPRVGEDGLGTFRQLSQLEVADTSDLRKRQSLGATGANDHGTIDDVESSGIGLQQLAGHHEDLLAQVARRPVDGLAADRNGARAERAATIGDCIGLARNHPHVVDCHAQGRGGDLGHDGVRALPLLLHTHRTQHASIGLEPDGARDRTATTGRAARRSSG